ncbi:MAG: RNA pseudouridine synthase [Pseudomonadota bacterium]
MPIAGPIEAHVPVESADANALDRLHSATGLPKQRIKHAMAQGAVWLTRGRNTQRLRRAKRPLREGDELHLYYDAGILAEIPPAPTLIADVGDYSVWHKPCGLRSQGSKWGDHCTITRWAERHLEPERPAFTVHRLDRAANGLILVAHGKRMAASLAALFRNREVEKRYRAVVHGAFPDRPSPIRIETPIDGKQAISEISRVSASQDGSTTTVDIRIETGRKHQIRRHLAELGHPILGDRLHGRGADDGVDLQLTAFVLAFPCPVRRESVRYALAGDQTAMPAA